MTGQKTQTTFPYKKSRVEICSNMRSRTTNCSKIPEIRRNQLSETQTGSQDMICGAMSPFTVKIDLKSAS